MNVLEFINKNILPLLCIAVGMVMLIICAFDGDAAYTAFWGVIIIVNQNTLFFSAIKELLEKENKNDHSRKA